MVVTREVWKEKILAQKKSGQSVKQWCLENNLNFHTFYGWTKKLGMTQPKVERHEELPVESTTWFALSETPTEPSELTIKIENGSASVSIKSGFDKQLLSEVILVVKNLC